MRGDEAIIMQSDLDYPNLDYLNFKIKNHDFFMQHIIIIMRMDHVHSGTIRLVTKGEHTSSALTAGRLEVYHSGQWGTVCGDGFHSTAATIACRQLGFSTYLSYGTVGSNTDVSSKR